MSIRSSYLAAKYGAVLDMGRVGPLVKAQLGG